ncbi:hypothetical protein [Nonomuraea longicatena]|uniref:Secreted protein n=1 Tax=Nonomuraea longicatena TaxID=83682 RepID=A0ABP3ZF18_9ACTN
MKRILLPAGGALLATGLLAAGLAGSAQADPDIDSATLAADVKTATETVNYWLASNGEAMKKATAYYYDHKDVQKVVQKGGYVADSKPSLVEPIGGGKTVTSKSHNVNFPKTIGKVFFQGSDGKSYWCSATSIQGNYRNLVATAGSCVYDVRSNDDVMDKWVFVPMYYDGKAPQGIYVGKQAFTHYDFSNYEDFDRDYAFVTVYNGVGFTSTSASEKEVSKSAYDAHPGTNKKIKSVELKDIPGGKTAEQQYDEGRDKYGPNAGYRAEGFGDKLPAGGSNVEGAIATDDEVEVTKAVHGAADPKKDPQDSKTWKNGDQGKVVEIALTEAEYKQALDDKAAGKVLGAVEKDAKGYWLRKYYVVQWYKVSKGTRYFKDSFFITEGGQTGLKDLGKLGDNVGGQGVAFSQKTGQTVRTFGYPYAKHPDGSKPFTGVTPKWCYGKTGSKATKVPALKIEEHVSLKCTVTGGYNGGPWLMKYSNAKRMGYVNGVTSVLYDDDKNERWDHISSPYFDGETAAVYKAASAAASGTYLPG